MNQTMTRAGIQGLTFQSVQSLRTVIEVYPESEIRRARRILKFDLALTIWRPKKMESDVLPEA